MGWDTTSYGNNNIPVRGTSTCYGMYNNAWVTNTGWPGGTSNHSMCEWLNTYNCSSTAFKAVPYVYCSNLKSAGNQCNLCAGFIRNEDRRFYFGVNCTVGKGTITVAGPLPTQTGTKIAGYKNNVMSNDRAYITIAAIASYGYIFAAWRYNTVSGTFWNNVSYTNVYHNSTAIQNGSVQTMWAQFL